MENQYFAATRDDGPYSLGPFPTKEDCIGDAKTEFADEVKGGECVFIGKGQSVFITIDGESLLDDLANSHHDDLYEDALSHWCDEITSDAKSDLGKRLTKVLHEWLCEQCEKYEFTVIECIGTMEEVEEKLLKTQSNLPIDPVSKTEKDGREL
jgi:hypothetical protein